MQRSGLRLAFQPDFGKYVALACLAQFVAMVAMPTSLPSVFSRPSELGHHDR